MVVWGKGLSQTTDRRKSVWLVLKSKYKGTLKFPLWGLETLIDL